ncbi:hypothetical protein QF025_002094 [Paraburkholderia graminis]|uniref:Uncharacterized protein n=1 Tax=Paraburkholderia graminis TaxID=60548 RepID=A0ABD5CDK2_9BURK|nr:hypothetical protein [Paraburkholderia graminis]
MSHSMSALPEKLPACGAGAAAAAGAGAGAFSAAFGVFFSGRCFAGRFDERDDGALRDFIAGFDTDFLDDAGGIARHFHGCLIGLERQQRLFFFDCIARFDIDFDDIDVLEVTDIRHFYFDETHSVP